MSFRNPLGSISALSLAAESAELPLLTTAASGVAVTIGAATFIYHAYKDYEEKKHRNELEEINRLHKKHLDKIFVPDYNEIRGFPPIFKLSEDLSKTDSMHLTDDEIEAIGKTLPHGTDIALASYREAILNAILKLQDYYFSRKTRKDPTSGVLSYLLYILETKCLNFAGYAYDIAYLSALSSFINAYASLPNHETSQHFTRLNPVYSYLQTAKQILEKHKESLTLEEMISELKDGCIHESNQMLRILVKMVTKSDNWSYVKTVTIDELSRNLLRNEYIHTQHRGIVLKTDKQKSISKSLFFAPWITELANYYLQTLDPDTGLSSKNVFNPKVFFSLPDPERLLNLHKQKKRTKIESAEMRLTEENLNSISRVFKKCSNFITVKLDTDPKKKSPQFVPITDHTLMIERAKVISDFASLTHEVISLQYLCTHLLKSIKQLGEIYVKNPKHFCHLFKVLDELCLRIKENIESNKKAFVLIKKSNKNTMRLEENEVFPDQVTSVLNTVSATVTRLGTRIKDYRDKITKHQEDSQDNIQSVKHEMFEVAALLSTIYGFAPRELSSTERSESQEIKANDETPPKRTKKSSSSKPMSLEIPNLELQSGGTSRASSLSDLANTPPTGNGTPRLLDEEPDNSPVDATIRLQTLDSSLKEMLETIEDMLLAEPNSAEIKTYKNLYQQLQTMQTKAVELKNETDKNEPRTIKANKILELTFSLAKETLHYIKLPREDRLKSAVEFKQKIHAELNSECNKVFIDDHAREFSKELYSICKIGLFSTNTRRRLNGFEEALEQVVESSENASKVEKAKVVVV